MPSTAILDLEGVGLALVGGALIGASVSFCLGVHGSAFSVASSASELLPRPTLRSVAVVTGWILSGALMANASDLAQSPLPASTHMSDAQLYSLRIRIAIGGVLSGLGVGLSKRESTSCDSSGSTFQPGLIMYAVCFLPTAALAATALGTSEAFPEVRSVDQSACWLEVGAWAGGMVMFLLGAAGLCKAATVMLRHLEGVTWRCEVLANLLGGLSFGVGLALSGTTQPRRVAAFFDVFSPSGWDVTPLLTVAGALFVSLPFVAILVFLKIAGPMLGGEFNFTFEHLACKAVAFNRTALLAAALSGFGCGTSGMHPAMVWLNLGAMPSPETTAAALSLVLGIGIIPAMKRVPNLARRKTQVLPIIETMDAVIPPVEHTCPDATAEVDTRADTLHTMIFPAPIDELSGL